MSLFEKITIKLNEAEVTRNDTNFDDSRRQYTTDQEKAEKLKKQRDALAKKKGYVLNPTEKKKGMRLGDKLEKDIDKGLKLQDKTIGTRTPRQGYDVGEPFQADDNKATKSGRYKTSGKKILDNRIKYGIDTTGITKDSTKERLKSRIRNLQDPKLNDPKEIEKFVDKVTDNQKLSNRKGKNSTLYKTLKRNIDAREPTQQRTPGLKPKRMVKGKDGVVRQYGGGQVPIKDAKRKADAVKKGVEKFERDIVKAAKLPKDTYIPKNTTGSAAFKPKELNLQFKADKMKFDYGGRIADRDPKISGMTAAEKKRNYEKIKAAIDKKNVTFKSPYTGGQIPVTPENMKKYKVNAQGFTKGQAARKSFKKFMKGAGNIVKKNKYAKIALGTLAVGGALFGGSKLLGRKKSKSKNLGPDISKNPSLLRDLPTSTYMDAKTNKPISYTFGAGKYDKVKNPDGNKINFPINSPESKKALATGLKNKSIYLPKPKIG